MIDAVMAHFMKTIGITGASLAIVRDEKLVYAKGFGEMAEGGEPVGPHTMFRIGEVSKAITSATIMTMFERGEFTKFRKDVIVTINIKEIVKVKFWNQLKNEDAFFDKKSDQNKQQNETRVTRLYFDNYSLNLAV